MKRILYGILKRILYGILLSLFCVYCGGSNFGRSSDFSVPALVAAAGGKLFIGNLGEDALQVVELGEALNDVTPVQGPNLHFPLRVMLPAQPLALAGSFDGGYVVVLSAGGYLSVLDTETLELRARVSGTLGALRLGADAVALAASTLACPLPCVGKFYVGMRGGSGVLELQLSKDDEGGEVLEVISALAAAGVMAEISLSNDGRYLFSSDASSHDVLRFDLLRGMVDRLDVGDWPGAIVANHDGSRVYVSRPAVRDVIVIDGAGTTLRVRDVDAIGQPALLYQCIASCGDEESCAAAHPLEEAVCRSAEGFASSSKVYRGFYMARPIGSMALMSVAQGFPPVVQARCGLEVTELSSETYTLAALDVGARVYAAGDDTFDAVGPYAGALHIQTDAQDSTGVDVEVSFVLTRPATVFVAYDRRASAPPAWIIDEAWLRTGETLAADTGVEFDVFAREFKAGPVVLGDNGDATAMYTVFMFPAQTTYDEYVWAAGSDGTVRVLGVPVRLVEEEAGLDDNNDPLYKTVEKLSPQTDPEWLETSYCTPVSAQLGTSDTQTIDVSAMLSGCPELPARRRFACDTELGVFGVQRGLSRQVKIAFDWEGTFLSRVNGGGTLVDYTDGDEQKTAFSDEAANFAESNVQVGDILEILSEPAADCSLANAEPCALERRITGFTDEGFLQLDTPLDSSCFAEGGVNYSLRVGDAFLWSIAGGAIGRAGPGAIISPDLDDAAPARIFARMAEFNPQTSVSSCERYDAEGVLRGDLSGVFHRTGGAYAFVQPQKMPTSYAINDSFRPLEVGLFNDRTAGPTPAGRFPTSSTVMVSPARVYFGFADDRVNRVLVLTPSVITQEIARGINYDWVN